jgi:hypothetical protein
MKKAILALVAGLIAVCANNTAHAVVVTVDGSKTWSGFMNVFNINDNGSKGGYLWGSGWGLAAVKSTVTGNTVTLEPNYNCFAPTDPYWSNFRAAGVDPVTEEAYPAVTGTIGNKFMEGSTFIEQKGLLNGSLLSFTGSVDSYSLDSAYSAVAFIKVFKYAGFWNNTTSQWQDAWDYNDQNIAYGSLTGGNFTVNRDLTSATNDDIFQYGFTVAGRNANPANTMGSVVVSAVPEPSIASLLGFGALGLVATRFRRRS